MCLSLGTLENTCRFVASKPARRGEAEGSSQFPAPEQVPTSEAEIGKDFFASLPHHPETQAESLFSYDYRYYNMFIHGFISNDRQIKIVDFSRLTVDFPRRLGRQGRRTDPISVGVPAEVPVCSRGRFESFTI